MGFWTVCNFIAAAAIILQSMFLLLAFRNHRYSLKKGRRQRGAYEPSVLLTVPCKGIDGAFEKNIASIFALDYDGFYLSFVVQQREDPAYAKLCELKDRLGGDCRAIDVRILVAGVAEGCSQKIHNLLFSCRNAPDNVEVFAFADSDAYLKRDWLGHLVNPLRKEKVGASTGYRWFVPEGKNPASLVQSSLNAKVAQMLGNTPYNQIWGGSMAIRAETFRRTELDRLWAGAISDDLCMSYAVKRAGLKVEFVPACLVASYEDTTWAGLLEFARRQFLITRVTMPRTWRLAFYFSFGSLAGAWGGLGLFIAAVMNPQASAKPGLYAAVAVMFFAGQVIRPILRQRMAAMLLPRDAKRMRTAAMVDIFGNWLWSWLMFACVVSSAFGRTITWRGIRYYLAGPTEVRIIPNSR